MAKRQKTKRTNNRPKKQIILFLVEGQSDRDALEIPITGLYELIDENIEVFFPIIREDGAEKGGDITVDRFSTRVNGKGSVSPSSIDYSIYDKFLHDFFDETKILPKDITEVIHIVDTDGAFIPNENVVSDESIQEPGHTRYEDDCIKCFRVNHITKRNEGKSENLKYLCSRETMKIRSKTVPYSVYFFSCNLDHFLHGDANLASVRKRPLATAFAERHLGDPLGFAKELMEHDYALKGMDYESSWKFIQEGTNSLKRYTNINVLMEKLLAQIPETKG